MRVVADLGSLRVDEERLYRRVDIQSSGLTEDRPYIGDWRG